MDNCKVEPAGDQLGHGDQVLLRAVATGSALGCLYQGVDRLEDAGVDALGVPGNDTRR